MHSRFFGSKSEKFPIKSTISPDGKYIFSGSEDGKPYLWGFSNKELQDSEIFQLSFMDCVADVAWSHDFHVVACAGFGKEYPILVYFWEREGNINAKDYKVLMEKFYKKEEIDENLKENLEGGNFRLNDFYEGSQANRENVRV